MYIIHNHINNSYHNYAQSRCTNHSRMSCVLDHAMGLHVTHASASTKRSCWTPSSNNLAAGKISQKIVPQNSDIDMMMMMMMRRRRRRTTTTTTTPTVTLMFTVNHDHSQYKMNTYRVYICSHIRFYQPMFLVTLTCFDPNRNSQ